MAEYIERETLMRKIHAKPEADGNKRAAKLLEYILSAPAADVAPVVHGRWELHGNDDDLASSYFCSLCGWNIDEYEYLDHFSHLRYCPNCGAHMDST